MSKEFSRGGYVGPTKQIVVQAIPTFIPRGGMCIKCADGSYEWIISKDDVRELGEEALRLLKEGMENV